MFGTIDVFINNTVFTMLSIIVNFVFPSRDYRTYYTVKED